MQRWDEQRSTIRGSPFSQRDSRTRHDSPDTFYPEKSNIGDKKGEPCEVLWIGFPSLLKVDETILRKAFTPFGEIEKITSFPGRSYAFVQFRSVSAACRAKETLQGKLFGNPRVHICFAKSEPGPSNGGRNAMNNAPPSPHFQSNSHPGSSENFRQERSFGNFPRDPSVRSPRFISNLETEDSDVIDFGRKGTLWTDGNGTFEHRRFRDMGSELGASADVYEHHSSPTRDRDRDRERGRDRDRERDRVAHFRDFSPQKFPRRSPFYEDPWDLPEDAYLFHGAKKLKTGSFPPEKELPEYPFSATEQEKHLLPPRTFSDFSQPEAIDKNFEPGSYGYKDVSDHPMDLTRSRGEMGEHWKSSYDGFQVGSSSLSANHVEWKRSSPEPHLSSLGGEWKWEGTIAKGGSGICRARCFPVGKIMDIML